MPRALIVALAAALSLLTALTAPPAAAEPREVCWILTLDYPLVRQLMIERAFPLPGQRAVAADSDDGCTRIDLAEPQLSGDSGMLKVRAKISVKAGVSLLGNCASPVRFDGYVDIWQQIALDQRTWRLKTHTVRTRLLDHGRRPVSVVNLVLNLVQENVPAYFDQFDIDLSPPRQDLDRQLPLFFKPEMTAQVESWLATLRPGKVEAQADAIRAQMCMTVDVPEQEQFYEETLLMPTDEEIDAFRNYWQAWDSFFVAELLSLENQPLTLDERDQVLTAMLDMRYGFLEALRDKDTSRDLVRRQFLETWSAISPILRKYGWQSPQRPTFNYFALMSASDALAALDRLGPAIGLDISREGLFRLAHLVSSDPTLGELPYSDAQNDRLRQVLGLGPAPERTAPAPVGEEILLPMPSLEQSSWLDFFVSAAHASQIDASSVDYEAIAPWLPPSSENAPQYIERVREMMNQEADAVERKSKLSDKHRGLLRLIIEASAWQESCWRQFIAGQGRVTYLRSYNNTSVGIMQIYLDVWRGLYDPDSLRWDIRYNARAGCEILALYMKRYALKKSQNLSDDILARSVYAMYNGGPGQLAKFLQRHKKGEFWLSDRLFWEKYLWVKSGQFQNIAACLVGG
ncbi:lytic transglycosylase domain-containing protein [Desulfarculus baarsii]